MPIDFGSGWTGIIGAFLGGLGVNDSDDPRYVSCEELNQIAERLGFEGFDCTPSNRPDVESVLTESITDMFEIVVNDLGDELDSIASDIIGATDSFIDTGSGVLDTIQNGITDLITGLFGGSDSDIGRLAADILRAIGNTSQGAILNLDALSNQVLGIIGSDTRNAISVITDLFGLSNSTINDLLREGTDIIGVLTERALDGITETLGFSVEQFEEIFDNVGEAMITNLNLATEQNEIVSQRIVTALDEQLEQSRLNAEAARGNLEDAIEAITGESQSALATTREALVETGDAQTQATREGAEQLSESVSGGFAELAQQLGDVARTFGTGTDPESLEQVRQAMEEVVSMTDCPPDFQPIIQAYIIEIFGRFTLKGGAAQAQMLLAAFQTFIGPVLNVLSNCIAQAIARQVPTSLPDASDLRDQVNRRLIDHNEAVNNLMSQGFSLERATRLIQQRTQLPDIGLVQTWFLRGFIDTNRAIEMLADLGLDNEAIENTIQMSFFIPPAADLITMAVRDVFNPDIAERFGQFEDFPQEFEQYAAQQGISRDWALRYWAAHWALPSPQQGFEMFQREIISEDDLDTLLRALDVMPFWRDSLKQMAYRPLPRVDVRRMNKLGLISDEDLPRRYRHFGFSPEDAQMMADFTIAYNRGTDADDATELAGITRSMALRLFKQGAITREQTTDILLEQGMSQEAADILIESEIVDREIEEREEQAKLIIEQAKAGALTFDQAQDRLGQLGLEPTELARSLTTLERARASATKIPSRADADRFIKAGVINEQEYLDILERNGYSQTWAQRYLQAVRAAE